MTELPPQATTRDGDPSRDIAYVEELVDRALGRPPSPGFGPTADHDSPSARPPGRPLALVRKLVSVRLKLLVYRVLHRFTAPIAREEVRAQLESFQHAQNGLRAGVASLEVAVEDLRDAVERLESEQAERQRDATG